MIIGLHVPPYRLESFPLFPPLWVVHRSEAIRCIFVGIWGSGGRAVVVVIMLKNHNYSNSI